MANPTDATAKRSYPSLVLLRLAVAASLARLGVERLPRAHQNARDSCTHRLRFLQRLAAHRPQTLCAGSATSLCVARGAVLAWGGLGGLENGLGGDLCLPAPVALPSLPVAVREVAAGDTHCLLRTDGGVHSWGADNAFGQLGHGDTKPRSVPQRIEALSARDDAPVQVACGRQHSLVLCADGTVYSFGQGAVGQLGLGSTADAHAPQCVALASVVGNEGAGEACAMPRVVRLSAGVFHSLAITEAGRLYSWGSGTNGRLGHGDTVMRTRPRMVEALGEVDVVHISAGSGHSLAVSRAGCLYTWGQGYNGRLGHGNQETKPQPEIVEALLGQTITQAVAGCEFTICATDKGAAFSFGHRDFSGTVWWGRGWCGGSARVLLPARIKALGEDRVAALAAGSVHTMLVTEGGELYTFGCGAQGQLGHGDLLEQLLPKKVELPVELP